MHSACTVVASCAHHRPPLQDFSIRAVKRRTWVRSSWAFHVEWVSSRRHHTRAGATPAYQITSVRYQQTMILRPSHHHNLFSHNPNQNVNFYYPNRRRRNAIFCRCSRTPRRMACTTVRMDLCPITIITTTQPTTTTPQRRDHRQSEVQMELTSAMWKIKTLSVSCAVTRAPASITDSLRAKVSCRSNGCKLIADRRMKSTLRD